MYDIDMNLVKAAREFIRKKEERIRRTRDPRFELARKDFRRIVRKLIKKYDPPRIYQWGSLLDRFYFHNLSDIDIAVEGVDTDTFWKM